MLFNSSKFMSVNFDANWRNKRHCDQKERERESGDCGDESGYWILGVIVERELNVR